MTTAEDRINYIQALEDELLNGGVILSEWCVFVSCQADIAFEHGAYLPFILTAVASIETHLRSEQENTTMPLVKLIDQASFSDDIKLNLHQLRRYRNKWVHVDTTDDQELLTHPERFEDDLERMAFFAARLLRQVIYSAPWV